MSTNPQDNSSFPHIDKNDPRFYGEQRERAVAEALQQYLHDIATKLEASEMKGRMEGRIEGRIERKIEVILTILRYRFNEVPLHFIEILQQQTDLIVLESLIVLAATCNSFDEFSKALE